MKKQRGKGVVSLGSGGDILRVVSSHPRSGVSNETNYLDYPVWSWRDK